LIFVLFGPGGVGKGTLAKRLSDQDTRLWLSKSWTTRLPRPNESDDAYVFVDEDTFNARVAQGGFLEWAEFLGHLYGTPVPDASSTDMQGMHRLDIAHTGQQADISQDGRDILLEIDIQGAKQIAKLYHQAVLIMVVAPDSDVQAQRLASRGDSPESITKRLNLGVKEVEEGSKLADHVVVNDYIDRACEEIMTIINAHRVAIQ
jgi:guanylate kinase